ncbi:MAG: PadR family transcriptional regulator [Acutalibacteraceae bacterium]
MKISKTLIKGSTSMLVMSVLKGKDLYGYKIIKELELRSESVFELKEGTLYPILHALEEEGFLESYWEEFDGRKRKYYHLTRKGEKQLNEKQQEWKLFSKSVDKVLETQFA